MRIHAEGVSVELAGRRIVDEVSVEAAPGSIVGVVGPNGSGKTTLLKCIYRLLQPVGGAVYLDGVDVRQLTRKASARATAVVAQHNDYAFNFTVSDLVLMGRSPHKRLLERDNAEDRRIVAEALDAVGLATFAERTYHTLSGGERQRVILARAIAQQAKCLVLDEPTNHLDVHHQLALLRIVLGLGVTTVAAFHDLTLAARHCDQLYVLAAGRVVAAGTAHSVLTPELLRSVFAVEAEVLTDSRGHPVIVYHGSSDGIML